MEVKDKIDRGLGEPNCIAARVWENNANNKLDFESLCYRSFGADRSLIRPYSFFFFVSQLHHEFPSYIMNAM